MAKNVCCDSESVDNDDSIISENVSGSSKRTICLQLYGLKKNDFLF
jgi:hypothetical protein